MSTPFLTKPADGIVRLPEMGGMAESVHVIDDVSIAALNAALATRRPLLVRGEPGTGKSQLARAAACLLGRAFLPHAVDARTETRDLLWTLDAVKRLATAQLMSALREVDETKVLARVEALEFITPGPIWWAFDWNAAETQAKRVRTSIPAKPADWTVEKGAVVLVDEIDKADASVPNGLLDALGHGRFDVEGRDPVVMKNRRPLIVMTTNEERAMPDAFLRRCLVLHLEVPKDKAALLEFVSVRGRAHFSQQACSDAVLQKAAEQLWTDREEHKRRDLSPPGLAEYIDLLQALTEQRPGDERGQLELLEQIKQFMFGKHPSESLR